MTILDQAAVYESFRQGIVWDLERERENYEASTVIIALILV